MNKDIKPLISDNPISQFQQLAIVNWLLQNVLDGFDAPVMALTTHRISIECSM